MARITNLARHPSSPRSGRRRAVAAVELAVLLPFLMFLFVAATDYCRVLYYTQVVTCCARNGAIYASDTYAASLSPYGGLEQAAKADASTTIAQDLTVTSTSGTDSSGSYVDVTVSYPFRAITNYPGIPQVTVVTRTARARVTPATPN